MTPRALQASEAILDDLIIGAVRWGPLLASYYMHGCKFHVAPGLCWLEPVMDHKLGDDALAGLQRRLPRLSLQPIQRQGPWLGETRCSRGR